MLANKMSSRIILTCIGGPLKKNEIKFLKNKSKYKNYVVGIDSNKHTKAKQYVDKFYNAPKGNSSKYIQKILEIVKKEKIDLIIPCSDEEALNLSKNKKKFDIFKCKIACDKYSTVKIFSNKIETYRILKKAKISVPEFYTISNNLELKKKIKIFIKKKLDFVIKPSTSRGGRNVYVIYQKNIQTKIHNQDRETHISLKNFLDFKIKNFPNKYPLILMERLYQPTYDLDMFAQNGKLINSVLRRRVIPTDPNAGHLIEKKQIKFVNLGNKIVKLFNLNWLYDCDIMLDKRGNPAILEINPRPSGSTSISLAGGFRLLDNIIEYSNNKKITKFKVNKLKKIMPNKIKF